MMLPVYAQRCCCGVQVTEGMVQLANASKIGLGLSLKGAVKLKVSCLTMGNLMIGLGRWRALQPLAEGSARQ